jgi:hypothetical protein
MIKFRAIYVLLSIIVALFFWNCVPFGSSLYLTIFCLVIWFPLIDL